MNPDTGAMYATLDEAVASGEKPEDIVMVEGRQEKIDKMIADLQAVQKQKQEKRRQVEKNRRNAVQASRKKNRRKK